MGGHERSPTPTSTMASSCATRRTVAAPQVVTTTPSPRRKGSFFPLLGLAMGPISLFAIAVIFAPWSSWSARGYGLAVVAINAGFFMKAPRRATWFGVVVLFAVVAVRIVGAAGG